MEVGSGWNGLRVPDGNLPQGAARTEEAVEEGAAATTPKTGNSSEIRVKLTFTFEDVPA